MECLLLLASHRPQKPEERLRVRDGMPEAVEGNIGPLPADARSARERTVVEVGEYESKELCCEKGADVGSLHDSRARHGCRVVRARPPGAHCPIYTRLDGKEHGRGKRGAK